MLGSIFTEDLIFEGKKCRTQRINEVFRLILLIEYKKQKNQKRTNLWIFRIVSFKSTATGQPDKFYSRQQIFYVQ